MDDTDLLLPLPIPVVVTRWQCPYCRRSRSRRKPCETHIQLCWKNPTLRGCKTCAFFVPRAAKSRDQYGGTVEDRCDAGFRIKDGLVRNCARWKEKDDGREAGLAT